MLDQGEKFPYDAGGEFWEEDAEVPPSAVDYAHYAARGIIAELDDRRGIKWELRKIDHETRADIVQSIAEIIRVAVEERLLVK
jgi:hypothetical protein